MEGGQEMPENGTDRLETASRLAQVISVVVGVVISIFSFNDTRQKEAAARIAEARTRQFELQKYYDQRREQADKQQIEAARPFLEMRQKRYMEAIQAAAVLCSPESHMPGEIQKARKRFWELYWAELSMVEGAGVENQMVELGRALKPGLRPTPQQLAAFHLAHALRDSLVESWGINEAKTGEVTR
jgi:hypothetical protein